VLPREGEIALEGVLNENNTDVRTECSYKLMPSLGGIISSGRWACTESLLHVVDGAIPHMLKDYASPIRCYSKINHLYTLVGAAAPQAGRALP